MQPVDLQAVLFDLDGTLVDSLPDLADGVNALRADFGCGALREADVAALIGKGMEPLVFGALARDGIELDAAGRAQAVAGFRRHFRTFNGRRTRLYPGVLDGLQAFRERDCRLAVVTNKSTEFTPLVLDKLGLAPFFDLVVCGETCAQRKPHPQPLLHACRQLEVTPVQALFVGDSIHDAEAAQAAGMSMLAVSYGYSGGVSMCDLPAAGVVDSITEAAAWAGCAPV